jgi:GWxTD domain-containing protein
MVRSAGPKALSAITAILFAAGLISLARAADQPKPATPAQKPPSAEKQSPAEKQAPAAPKLPGDWDRAVTDFLRSPAILLLTPQEIVAYDKLTGAAQRRMFIERFWTSMAANCLEGTNPLRDQVLHLAAEADDKFGDEGIPGWLTDRGRVYALLGAPEKTETKTGPSGPVLIWTWPARPDRPKTVAFVREGLEWVFAGADTVDPQAPAVEARQAPLDPATGQWAAKLRSVGCELTPEMRAQAATVTWRRTLFDLAGQVLSGEKPEVANPVEPSWYFFPAEGDATFVVLTITLDKNPESGDRPVAMLRMEGAEDTAYTMGTTEIPFEIRQVGGNYIAQAVRTLPPGRYAFAVGAASASGGVTPRAVGEQVVVRMPKDALRMTSVILADRLQPIEGSPTPAPFKLYGFDVTPNPTRVFQPGSPVTLFFVVVGAAADPQGKLDLKVS